MREPFKKLLEGYDQAGGKDTAVSDVFDGVSDPKRPHYFGTIAPLAQLSGGEGAWLWNHQDDENEQRTPPAKPDGFKQRLGKELCIGGKAFVFRYFRATDPQSDLQFLDDHDGAPGHLSRASNVATPLAEAIAPGNRFLRTLLADAARCHDEGKRHPKWQRAFGRPHGQPEIAKLHPKLKKPAPLGGFRHEWESVRKLAGNGPMPPADLPPEAQALWSDLLLHLVGAHHGHLRPSIADSGLTPDTEPAKQNPLRLKAAEHFARLHRRLGHWRLAYLEAVLRSADAEGSHDIREEEDDGN